jgi:hypothetical protein
LPPRARLRPKKSNRVIPRQMSPPIPLQIEGALYLATNHASFSKSLSAMRDPANPARLLEGLLDTQLPGLMSLNALLSRKSFDNVKQR